MICFCFCFCFLFYFILFYLILFYFILFYFILFYLFYFILFYLSFIYLIISLLALKKPILLLVFKTLKPLSISSFLSGLYFLSPLSFSFPFSIDHHFPQTKYSEMSAILPGGNNSLSRNSPLWFFLLPLPLPLSFFPFPSLTPLPQEITSLLQDIVILSTGCTETPVCSDSVSPIIDFSFFSSSSSSSSSFLPFFLSFSFPTTQ